MLKWINKKRNTKGFTLVELIVVIAIIGIIGAIAVPRFTNLQNSSKVKADAATAQEIVNAARIQEVDTGVKVTSLEQQDDKDGVLDKNYMKVPKPQSGDNFEIVADSGGDKPYEVTWTPINVGIYSKEQKVTEGEPFDIKETKK